jgi:phosphatidylglycerophosphate synthase
MFVEDYLKDLRRRHYSPRAAVEYGIRCFRMSAEAAWNRPKALSGVLFAGLGHLVALFGLAVVLSLLVDRGLAMDYFILSAWWLLGGLTWITLHLAMFRRDEDLPLSGLGLPNFITIGRLLSIPAFYIFITGDYEALALAAFAAGGLSDIADGVAARRLGASTRMGRIFDPIVDVLFNTGVALGLTRAGYLPQWIFALIGIRYGLLMFGAAWIYVTRGPVAVRPTVLGKTTGVITSGLVLGVLLVGIFVTAAAREQVLELLYSALGFVLLLTIVQVIIIGVFNMRYAGHVPKAKGPLGVVVGGGTEAEPPSIEESGS